MSNTTNNNATVNASVLDSLNGISSSEDMAKILKGLALDNGLTVKEDKTSKDTKQVDLANFSAIKLFGGGKEMLSMSKTVKQYVKMFNNHEICLDNEAQRGTVWTRTQQSALIESILLGISIPTFYLNNRTTDINGKTVEVKDVLDGKQRSTAIIKFVNDSYRLTGINPLIWIDNTAVEHEIDLNGLLFSELPEDFQDAIYSYNLDFKYYSDLEQDDVYDLFLKLNSGSALKSNDVTRNKVADKASLNTLNQHKLFSVILTDKALDSHTQDSYVLKSLRFLSDDEDKCVLADRLDDYFGAHAITSEESEKLTSVMDLQCSTWHKVVDIVKSIRDEAKQTTSESVKADLRSKATNINRWKSVTHMPSTAPIFYKAVLDGRTADEMASLIRDFFESKDYADKAYRDGSKTASCSKDAVNKRLTALNSFYDNYAWNEVKEA